MGSTQECRAETWDPWEWAKDQRIRVEYYFLPPDLLGTWDPVTRTITLAHGMSGDQDRSVLTHECGHAWHHHVGCTPRGEREADSWAADQLITADDYARAEQLYGRDLALIAAELGVMRWVVDAWRRNERGRRWAGYFSSQDLIA